MEQKDGKDHEQRKVLKNAVVWKDLYIYRKSDTIYQLTVAFCKHFLPPYGDRTVDQMIQAARSCKQNIVEGCEDGQTSSQMEINLINVARGSLQELQTDYNDYINTRHLTLWPKESERQRKLMAYCKTRNDFKDYEPLIAKMNDEEMANLLITLCRQTDKMLCSYIKRLELRNGCMLHAPATGKNKTNASAPSNRRTAS